MADLISRFEAADTCTGIEIGSHSVAEAVSFQLLLVPERHDSSCEDDRGNYREGNSVGCNGGWLAGG